MNVMNVMNVGGCLMVRWRFSWAIIADRRLGTASIRQGTVLPPAAEINAFL
jgi:hypothetical protein